MTKMLKQMTMGLVMVAVLGLVGESQSAFAQMAPQVSRVNAFDTDVWRVWVPAGGRVTVRVVGDHATDLDLFVLDGYGYELGRYDDSTDHCIVRLFSGDGGYIRIFIRNLGSVYNRYRIQVDVR